MFGGIHLSPAVAHWLCDHAWWLIVDILSYQAEPQPSGVQNVPWQFWTITRRGDSGGVITCQEDEGKPNLITHEYWVIDLPYDGDSMELVYAKAAPGIPASLYFIWEH